MKKLLLTLFLAFATLYPLTTHAADSTFVCGINWFNVGDGLHQNDIIKLFSDTIPFNMFHGGSDDSLTMSKIHGMFVYPQKPAINRLSGGERMLYKAIKHRVAAIENINYYFSANGHHVGEDWPSAPLIPTHWMVIDSSDSTEVLILDSNEFSGRWRFARPGPLKLAASLRVSSLASGVDTNKDVITIVLKEDTGATAKVTLRTFHVRWGDFTSTTADKVFFLPDSIIVPYNISENDGQTKGGGLLLEVHSKRFVTTRIAWVAVEDLIADSVLAGVDMDSNNAARFRISDTVIRNEIVSDTVAITHNTGNKLAYFCLVDEPRLTQLKCCGRINQLMGYRGTAEVQGDDGYVTRYVAQVNPKSLWYGAPMGGTGTAAYVDQGLMNLVGYPDVHSIDTSVSGNGHAHGGHGLRQNDSDVVAFGADLSCSAPSKIYFPLDTVRKYKGILYGYFGPSGLDSANIKGYSYCDYSARGGLDQRIALGHLWTAAQIALSPRTDGALSEWWGNIFIHTYMARANHHHGFFTSGISAAIDTQRFQAAGGSTTPEVLSCNAHTDFAFGAHGLMFFKNIAENCDPSDPVVSHLCTGFANEDGSHDKDNVPYQVDGVATYDTMPTMYKRNTKWAFDFVHWLNTYAKELKPMKWLGAFARDAEADTSQWCTGDHMNRREKMYVLDSSQLSKMSFLDVTKDSCTRNYWPMNAGDTLHRDSVIGVRDSMTFLIHGFFVNPTDSNVKYLYTVNLWQDARSLDGKWIQNSDSVFMQRGTRTIFQFLTLDSVISKWWKVSVLDSTKWDTVLRASAQPKLVATFLPGQGRIFKIEPAPSPAVANGMLPYQNGRRMEYSNGFYFLTYARNDSVLFRKSKFADNPYYWNDEIVIAPTPTGWHSWLHADRPSLRLLHSIADTAHGPHARTGIGITYQVLDDTIHA